MGRNRVKNLGLPKYMYKRGPTYYFVDPGSGRWIRLSRDYAIALSEYAKHFAPSGSLATFDDIADRFVATVLPSKSSATKKEYSRQLRLLRAGFGGCRLADITAQDIRIYRDERTSGGGPTAANRELALLSSIFGWAVEWGAVSANPCQGVKRNAEQPRIRLPSLREFQAFKNFAGSPIAEFMELARLTALRRSDVLRIRLSDIRDGYLLVETSKTGKALQIELSTALRDAIDHAKALRRPISSMHLICKRNGSPYTPDGFSSIWQRKMKAAVEAGVVNERFTMHDIRAMSASAVSPEHAQSLLGHSNPTMTIRYRRGPERVKPIE